MVKGAVQKIRNVKFDTMIGPASAEWGGGRAVIITQNKIKKKQYR